jgi:hypothetical protein
MYGIALVTYAEAKEMYNNLVLSDVESSIEDDVYGFITEDYEYNLIYYVFNPVKLENNNEFLNERSLNKKEE